MKGLVVVASLVVSLGAQAAQPVTPALLPKLIGSSAFVLEQHFGNPVRPCKSGQKLTGEITLFCEHQVEGKALGFTYHNGILTEVVWFAPKGLKVGINDLQLDRCSGPFVQRGSGGSVWSGCGGGLSVELQGVAPDDAFLIHVATRNLLSP